MRGDWQDTLDAYVESGFGIFMEEPAFICCYRLDGNGGATQLSAEDARAAWAAGDANLWIHLNRSMAESATWIRNGAGLDPLVAEAMLAAETRPRFDEVPGGIQINLRGVNLNEGAVPEDMVSIRGFSDGQRLVTARLPRLRAVDDIRTALQNGRGPKNAVAVLTAVADRLTYRIGDLVMQLDDQVDLLEDSPSPNEGELATLRRRILELRRYMMPQREALARAASGFDTVIDKRAQAQFTEVRERTARVLEDLDVLRDQTQFIREEIADERNTRMNRAMYTLSIVTGIFLPLGFLTGLLGINVGGMPGMESPYAFWIVCILILAVAGGVWGLFKKYKWL